MCSWICLSVHVHGLYLTVYFLWMLGGSETFQDKVSFFQRELRHIHSKRPRIKTCLKISRHAILDSVSSSICWSLPVLEVFLWISITWGFMCLCFYSLLRPPETSQYQTGVRTLRWCFRMKKVCHNVSHKILLIVSMSRTWLNELLGEFLFVLALDWGGPRREWFELVCKNLFDTNNQLFTRFSDNNQGLVSISSYSLHVPKPFTLWIRLCIT